MLKNIVLALFAIGVFSLNLNAEDKNGKEDKTTEKNEMKVPIIFF